jgi:hypothetical protein
MRRHPATTKQRPGSRNNTVECTTSSNKACSLCPTFDDRRHTGRWQARPASQPRTPPRPPGHTQARPAHGTVAVHVPPSAPRKAGCSELPRTRRMQRTTPQHGAACLHRQGILGSQERSLPLHAIWLPSVHTSSHHAAKQSRDVKRNSVERHQAHRRQTPAVWLKKRLKAERKMDPWKSAALVHTSKCSILSSKSQTRKRRSRAGSLVSTGFARSSLTALQER